MDALVERLVAKLREWNPIKADQVRHHVTEIIDLADRDALDIVRSRVVEQPIQLEPSELAESVARTRLALDQIERDEGTPFEEFDREFRRKFQIPSDA